jgi:hypothetical protein
MSVKGAQVDTAHGALDREIFDNGFPSDNGGCRDSDQGIPPHTGAVNAMLRNLRKERKRLRQTINSLVIEH